MTAPPPMIEGRVGEPTRETTVQIISLRVPRECVRSHELFVAHSDLSLQRGLEPGERLVIRDARAGGAYVATVAEVEFLMEDTVYRLNLRGRLPHGVAAQAPAARRGDRFDVAEVVDLLAWLRKQAAPAQSKQLADSASEPIAARA